MREKQLEKGDGNRCHLQVSAATLRPNSRKMEGAGENRGHLGGSPISSLGHLEHEHLRKSLDHLGNSYIGDPGEIVETIWEVARNR